MANATLMGRAGLKIRAADGLEESGFPEIMSTPLFYFANPGDRLSLKNHNYKYNLATYEPKVEDKWLYTYAYAPDQSWTVYRNDMIGPEYRQEDKVFNEHVYFRLCLRKTNGGLFDGSEDISEIIAFETNGQSLQVNEWVKEEVFRVAAKINSLRKKEDLVFAILTDTHYNVNGTWNDTLTCIKLLNEQIGFNGIIHLGDLTDGMVTQDATHHYVENVLADLKSCCPSVWVALGNHDSNYFKNNLEPLSVEQQRKLYLDGRELRYYVDFPHIRFIFLDSFDPNEALRYGYSEECTKWLEQTLGNMHENRKAVIFSHLPPVTRLQFWAKAVRGDKEISDVLARFPKRILAWINGHNHADRVDNEEGFPVISIANAKCEAFTEYKTDGFVTPERKLNSVSQELWDVLVINPDENILRFVRFGAGNDKMISGGSAVWV